MAKYIPKPDAKKDEAALLALVKAKTPMAEICRIMGRAPRTIHLRISALRDEGAFDDDDESPMPKGDHDGFMKALRKAGHHEGVGEITGIAGRGHFARLTPAPDHSGVGSPAQLAAEN